MFFAEVRREWRESSGAKKIMFVWVALFLAINLAVLQGGGDNPNSRLAAIEAFLLNGNFKINDYTRQTIDWSRTPDGNYYSNKAPGGIILGIPILYTIAKLRNVFGAPGKRNLYDLPNTADRSTLSVLTQLIPFAVLIWFVCLWMQQLGLPASSILFFLVASLHANTAAIYMNTYFGHAQVALFQLVGLFFLMKRRYFWAGSGFLWALACDHSFLAQIPAMAVALWISIVQDKKSDRFAWAQPARLFLAGTLLPLFLVGAYQAWCFGSPFTMPQKFQRPEFLMSAADGLSLFGMFRVPPIEVLFELLVGTKRGILFTQPWVLVGLADFLWQKSGPSRMHESPYYLPILSWFAYLSLVGLLAMNLSFNGWHGGAAAGPRYLSGIFPVIGLALAFRLSELTQFWRRLAWVSLGFAVFVRAGIYGTSILASSEMSLFASMLTHFTDGNWQNNGLRLGLYLLGLAVCVFVTIRVLKRELLMSS